MNLVAILLIVMCQQPAAEQGKAIRDLQGDWLLQTHEVRGVNIVDDSVPIVNPTMVSIKDDELTLHYFGHAKVKMAVNTSASPKTIDFIGPKCVVARGIYALDGDVLLMAIAWYPLEIRPDAFKSSKKDVTLVILKRKPK
jgi:uncharacterized protein (TIGR03067 family)